MSEQVLSLERLAAQIEEKRWVYVTCASCGYDNSLPKIWEELA